MPRHKGDIGLMQLDRNREMFAIYTSLKRSCEFESFKDVCQHMVSMPVACHYISEERALRILRYYLKTGELLARTPYKRRMYESFINVCNSVMAKGEENLPMVARTALTHGAPCLGLSRNRIAFILHKMGAK